MAPIHQWGQEYVETEVPLSAIPPFLHALGAHETFALLFIQNNLNALDGCLVFRNQQIFERVDAALGLFQFRGYPPHRTADLGPRTEDLACFDPPGPSSSKIALIPAGL